MENALDGVIKFQCQFTIDSIIYPEHIVQLNTIRAKAIAMHWIGEGKSGIGFGNLSQRDSHGSFLISGSQTGGTENLGVEGYSRVTDWNIDENWIVCKGLCKASSESMSHAAIYEMNDEIRASIHIHSQQIWNTWTNLNTRTNPLVAYGTPGMAREIQRAIRENGMEMGGVLCMGGHEDGIIAWGSSLEDAWEKLIRIRCQKT